MYVWDENKREANLVKHKLDFADAGLVYENPDKLTVISTRQGKNGMPTLRSSNSQEVASPSSTLNGETKSESFPSDPPRGANRIFLRAPESRSDWAHVQKTIATDAPIPYDPEDGPYDPNDEAAVEAYWEESIVRAADGTILQQPALRKYSDR